MGLDNRIPTFCQLLLLTFCQVYGQKKQVLCHNGSSMSIELTGVNIFFVFLITAKSCKKLQNGFLTGVELQNFFINRNMTCKNFFKFCSSKSYYNIKKATVSSGFLRGKS